MVYGHQNIVDQLDSYIPQTSLFLGPSSVGKWEVANYIRFKKNVKSEDYLAVRSLTAERAREVNEFCRVSSHSGHKLVVIGIDFASDSVLTILLKTLEELADSIYIVLIATQNPLATISSRCHVFHFSYLSDSDIQRVLIERKAFSEDFAKKIAPLARGQIDEALWLAKAWDFKDDVLALVASIIESDKAKLDGMARLWTDERTKVLIEWCQEAITKSPRLFSEMEIAVPNPKLPLRILLALNSESRPKLLIRYSLAEVLEGR